MRLWKFYGFRYRCWNPQEKLSDMHRQSGIYTAAIVQKDGFGAMEGESGTVCLGGLPGVILETDGISPENL